MNYDNTEILFTCKILSYSKILFIIKEQRVNLRKTQMYILQGKTFWFQPSMFLISEHSLFHRTSDT